MDIGKHLGRGWDLTRSHPVPLLLGALIAMLLAGTLILAGPAFCALFYVYLKAHRGQAPEIADLFKGFGNLSQSIVAGILFLLANTVGALVIVGPLLVSGIFLWTFPFIVDKGMDWQSAFKASLALTKRNFVPNLLFAIVITLVAGAGSIACVIGIFVTSAIAFGAAASAFEEATCEPAVESPGETPLPQNVP